MRLYSQFLSPRRKGAKDAKEEKEEEGRISKE